MKRALATTALIALLLSACSPSGADVVVGVDADTNDRGAYTQAQVDAFKSALISETKKINVPEGMEPDYTNIDQTRFEAIVTRAQAVCDDARTRGWDSARTAYEDQILNEALISMPTDFPTTATTESEFRAMTAPFAESTLRAISGQGSLCPELAPEGFLAQVPASAPSPQGKYYGEGCDGAAGALMELLPLVKAVDSGSPPPGAADQLLDIAAGFVYASTTEPDKAAAAAIDGAVEPVLALQTATANGDASSKSSTIAAISSAAISIIDTCGLE